MMLLNTVTVLFLVLLFLVVRLNNERSHFYVFPVVALA